MNSVLFWDHGIYGFVAARIQSHRSIHHLGLSKWAKLCIKLMQFVLDTIVEFPVSFVFGDQRFRQSDDVLIINLLVGKNY